MKNKFVKTLCIFGLLVAACTPTVDGPDAPTSRPDTLVEIPTATTTPVASTNHRYGNDARECLIKAMYFEARGTGRRGMRAVGEVILNRSDSSKFPNTACGVLNQRYNGSCQFSFICDGIADRYREPAQRAIAANIADELLSNRGKDITNGALFFHAAWMKPGWFGTLSPRGRFGKQLFYR